jgi:hypothetical protein
MLIKLVYLLVTYFNIVEWLKLKSLISVKAVATNRLSGWVNAQAASSGIPLLKKF